MCLIAYRPGAKRRKDRIHLPQDVANYNCKMNPDGFGLVYRERKNSSPVTVRFGPSRAAEFIGALYEIDADASIEYAAHWRWATHGPKVERLAHPYSYRDSDGRAVHVMHNGIIPIATKDDESDTERFVRTCLAKMPPRWYADEGLSWCVNEAIGGSRLLVMPDGDPVVRLGHWQDGESGVHYSAVPVWSTAPAVKATPPTAVTPMGAPTAAPTRAGRRLDQYRRGWTGHDLVFASEGRWMDDEEGDEDSYGSVECLTCSTAGDWYFLNGKMYVDIKHQEKQ